MLWYKTNNTISIIIFHCETCLTPPQTLSLFINLFCAYVNLFAHNPSGSCTAVIKPFTLWSLNPLVFNSFLFLWWQSYYNSTHFSTFNFQCSILSLSSRNKSYVFAWRQKAIKSFHAFLTLVLSQRSPCFSLLRGSNGDLPWLMDFQHVFRSSSLLNSSLYNTDKLIKYLLQFWN